MDQNNRDYRLEVNVVGKVCINNESNLRMMNSIVRLAQMNFPHRRLLRQNADAQVQNGVPHKANMLDAAAAINAASFPAHRRCQAEDIIQVSEDDADHFPIGHGS